MALRSGSISIHANDMQAQAVEDVCRATLGCGHADMLFHLLLFLATGLLTLFVVATIIHLHEARAAVSEERSRTAAEHDAFAAFTRRIAALDADVSSTQPTTSSGPVATMTAESRPPDHGLQQVVEAYRETIMAVPHYDEDYDESLAANMAAEFGEEVATAVVGGSRLTPQLKQALIQGSRDAQDRRRELLTGLDRETDDLDGAHETFTDVDAALGSMDDRPLSDRSFDDLVGVWRRLGELEDRCARRLNRRQERIHEWSMGGPRTADAPTLHEYLYQPLSVTYPVLAEGTALVERIRTARGRALGALTRRA